ncbi:MAG: bifunctional phosphopantothenoylcysteine decarboxylase/phosphopantothenate--cysteine ligase CoaBC [Oligoflexia bacterium]|nr:bifunctional phosphopantothenoylcysteine decarboxylase/phosphopantothenate--cysteine ligase CoaBC [Oligoflexia bacterium]
MSEKTEKRNVVLGITGSIAAYKAAELARLLVTRGFDVRCIMTECAQQFITSTTMQAVTGRAVATNFWEESEAAGIGHIQLADWAEALVVAPATADSIAKMAAGFADSPLLAVALATRAPIVVAPAMNVNMLTHPKTQENLEILRARGVHIVDPDEGALACGWNGAGRLAEPTEIFERVRNVLSAQDFAGRRIVITTGPTREALDPVRFISNRSSGKMGAALAREAYRRGAQVHLIHGPIHEQLPRAIKCQEVVSAEEMHRAVMATVASKSSMPDIVVMAAAVADYRPSEAAQEKIKKTEKSLNIKLVQNPDILHELGQLKRDERKPLLVGFAVETGEEIENLLGQTRAKLKHKNADMIVGNFAHDAFDLDTNRVWLVDRNGRQQEVATTDKWRVANKILDAILTLG